MKNWIRNILLVLFIIVMKQLNAQQITGLWEVKEVKVGSELMTPVAKWMKFEADGTFTSGNGWLQNSAGNWMLTKEESKLTLIEEIGLKDPFGAFKLNMLNSSTMKWTRVEEGEEVVVSLNRIDEIPQSLADQLRGLWSPQYAQSVNKSNTDQPQKDYLFLRWDRVAIERDALGNRSRGYWHIHAHRPLLTIMGIADKEERWSVELIGNRLKMIGVSSINKGEEREYIRLLEFPE